MHVSELLRSVKANQDAFERAKVLYRDRLAPDFNPFDFIEPDEMRLSSILAWLLNPKATHGQNGRFLHLFVEQLFRGHPELAWSLEACAGAKVATEVQVSGGRLDILVTSDKRTVLIENKAGAGDGPDQLKRYAAYLDSLNQAHTRLIYLTPDGSEPTEGSIDKNERIERGKDDQLHCWSYREHILGWLAKCRAVCRADRVSTFIDEFSRYIHKRFEGVSDMTVQDQLVQDVTRSVETVESAMQVIRAADAIRVKLILTLHYQLESEIAKNEGWSLSDWNMSTFGKFSGFRINFSARSRYFLSISFQNTYFNGLIYGVEMPGGPTDERSVPAALAAALGSGKQSKWWAWYRPASLEEPVFKVEPHWGSTVTPWVAIADGTMAGVIIKTAGCFRKAMDRCGLL